MSDLYSEFLVKKESTAKDAIVKYGLIVLTILAAGAGLFISWKPYPVLHMHLSSHSSAFPL